MKWQTRYLKRSHKFGIELLRTVEKALTLDAKMCNTLWADAISKEMENNGVAFNVLSDGKFVPIGLQFVPCHVVFNVKMEDFRHKAWLVAGGNMTEELVTITYASVVSRETVRISMTIAAW